MLKDDKNNKSLTSNNNMNSQENTAHIPTLQTTYKMGISTTPIDLPLSTAVYNEYLSITGQFEFINRLHDYVKESNT